MKNGKKPSREQRKLIAAKGLNAENWLIVKDTPELMLLVHRYSDTTQRVIFKEN